MSELSKEWEAIVAENSTCGEHYAARVRNAVERCYALTQKPVRELTESECMKVYLDWERSPITEKTCWSYYCALLKAHQRKQREPETVKFRAARNEKTGEVLCLRVDDAPYSNEWKWLDVDGKPQEYEVTLP